MDSVTGSTETLFNAASGIGNAVRLATAANVTQFLTSAILTDGGFQLNVTNATVQARMVIHAEP
jgi:hypothetical protein